MSRYIAAVAVITGQDVAAGVIPELGGGAAARLLARALLSGREQADEEAAEAQAFHV